jgi:hypothetical protein
MPQKEEIVLVFWAYFEEELFLSMYFETTVLMPFLPF